MDARQLERLTRIFSAILSPIVIGCGPGDGEVIDEAQFTDNLCDGSLRALDATEPAESRDVLHAVRFP